MDSDGSCHDVNECLDEDVCNGIGTCINLDGGYDCECPAGLFKSKLHTIFWKISFYPSEEQ